MDALRNPFLLLAICAAAAAGAAWLVGLGWVRGIAALAGRTRTDLDDRLARATRLGIQGILLFGGTLAALDRIADSHSLLADHPVVGPLRALLLTGTVLSFAWIASRTIEELASSALVKLGRTAEAPLETQLMPLVRKFVRLAAFFIAATVVLGAYDVKITALLGAAGVASLAVALAAQETLANVIGGLTIMIDRPFRIGDRIELPGERLGDVHEIGLRTTKILTLERTLLIVPNSEIVKATITNHSYPDPRVAIRFTVGVAYGTDLDKAKYTILQVLRANRRVLPDPPPRVWFSAFGESSLELLISYSVGSYTERLDVMDEVNMELKKRLEEADIEIPFPQRVVTLKGAAPSPRG